MVTFVYNSRNFRYGATRCSGAVAANAEDLLPGAMSRAMSEIFPRDARAAEKEFAAYLPVRSRPSAARPKADPRVSSPILRKMLSVGRMSRSRVKSREKLKRAVMQSSR